MTAETLDQWIRNHFHALSDEQFEEYKNHFFFCEIKPMLLAFGKMYAEYHCEQMREAIQIKMYHNPYEGDDRLNEFEIIKTAYPLENIK